MTDLSFINSQLLAKLFTISVFAGPFTQSIFVTLYISSNVSWMWKLVIKIEHVINRKYVF